MEDFPNLKKIGVKSLENISEELSFIWEAFKKKSDFSKPPPYPPPCWISKPLFRKIWIIHYFGLK